MVLILASLMMGLCYYRKLWALGAFMMFLGLHMALNIYLTLHQHIGAEHLRSRLVFLYGPALYFFLKEITLAKLSFNKADLVHLVPFTLLLFIPFNALIFAIASIVTYSVLMLKYTIEYEKVIQDQLGDELSARLVWLKNLVLFLVMLIAYDIGRSIGEQYGVFRHPAYFAITLVLLIMLVLFLAFFSLEFKSRFVGLYPTDFNSKNKTSDSPSLDIEWALERLYEDKLYLKHDLRLSDFAEHLNLDARTLSEQLFEKSGIRFPKRVQKLRIKKAQEIIEEKCKKGDKVNILNVAYDAGFQAKSSFNLAFKEETGITPTQYKNSITSN